MQSYRSVIFNVGFDVISVMLLSIYILLGRQHNYNSLYYKDSDVQAHTFVLPLLFNSSHLCQHTQAKEIERLGIEKNKLLS